MQLVNKYVFTNVNAGDRRASKSRLAFAGKSSERAQINRDCVTARENRTLPPPPSVPNLAIEGEIPLRASNIYELLSSMAEEREEKENRDSAVRVSPDDVDEIFAPSRRIRR